jgi:ACR3 family arsenite efflux pump ArsB
MSEKLLTIWHLVSHIGILEMIVLHFSLQGEDMIEHIIDICHVFTFWYAKGKMMLSMLITTLMCSHPSI